MLSMKLHGRMGLGQQEGHQLKLLDLLHACLPQLQSLACAQHGRAALHNTMGSFPRMHKVPDALCIRDDLSLAEAGTNLIRGEAVASPLSSQEGNSCKHLLGTLKGQQACRLWRSDYQLQHNKDLIREPLLLQLQATITSAEGECYNPLFSFPLKSHLLRCVVGRLLGAAWLSAPHCSMFPFLCHFCRSRFLLHFFWMASTATARQRQSTLCFIQFCMCLVIVSCT